jgi:hypothetical protein
VATVYRTIKGDENPASTAEHPIPGYTRELFGDEIEVCNFCRERNASAYWTGNHWLSVCRGCALDILPKLLADAIIGERVIPDTCLPNVLRDLEKIQANFWPGIASAFARVMRLSQREDKQRPPLAFQQTRNGAQHRK